MAADKAELERDLRNYMKRVEDRKIALQYQKGGKLSIVGTMSGDPFKKLHEEKASKMRNVVNQAVRKT